MPVFKFRNSTTASSTPTAASLASGEISVNITDARIYQGTTSQKITDSFATQAANSVAITGGTVSVTNLGTSTRSTMAVSSMTHGGTSLSVVAAPDTNTTGVATRDLMFYRNDDLQGKLKNVYTYTGNATYTKSGPDVTRLHVVVCGGGGGGRAYSECGGAGGYAEVLIDATSITTVAVTIGGAGSGGAYFGFSPGGGTTSFGSYVTAPGGGGANAHIQHNGGLGGLGATGSGIINGFGTRGGGGGGHNNMDQYSSSCAPGGDGGISFFGGGQPGGHSSGAQPSDVAAWGAGGVAVSPSHNGQGGRNGKGGICIVYEYK